MSTAYVPSNYQESYSSSDISDLASRFTRLFAVILDCIVVFVPTLPMFLSLKDWGSIVESKAFSPESEQAINQFKETGVVSPELEVLIADVISVLMSSANFSLFLLLSFILIICSLLFILNGQTIGKKICGIRVVRTDGSRAGFWRCFFVRWFIAGIVIHLLSIAVSLIPVVGLVVGPFVGLIGILMIFGESRRCLHDLISDTIVINS